MRPGSSIRRWLSQALEEGGRLFRAVPEPVGLLLVLAPTLEVLGRYLFRPSDFRRWFHAWATSSWFEPAAYGWWFLGEAVLFFSPALFWRLRYRRTLRDQGLRWGEARWTLWILLLWTGMALLLLPISTDPAFAQKYPFLDLARTDWRWFLLYELGYGLYFFAFEYHFRGWVLRTLGEWIGPAAIWVQVWPYVLTKLGKPLPEMLAALPAGLLLGWLAWRSRSFLYGWLLHWGVACWLDLLIVWQGRTH